MLRQKALIRQLTAQREKAHQQIEQRTLAAVNGIAAAHPNIRLSRLALESAEKYLASIQDKYAQGEASILDLLDAQQGRLSQKQQTAVAIYTYMQEIHRIQRSIVWFEFQKTDAEKRAWTEPLTQFLRKH